MSREKVWVCPNPECDQIIPFVNPNFCCFCGQKVTAKDFRELPVCPQNIPKGHCDECRAKQAKKCDACGSTDRVEYRPELGNRCLCYADRMAGATALSRTRSW